MKFKFPLITFFAIIAIVTLLWLFQNGNQEKKEQSLSFNLVEESKINNLFITSSDAVTLMGEALIYKHPLGFSFKYPKNFTVVIFPEGEDGQTLLVQDSSRTLGFQLYMTSFDEDGSVLTSERIKSDIPDISIENPQPVNVLEGGKGITFVSGSPGHKVREVWFVINRYLYQVTTNVSNEALLLEILKTFAF